LDGSDTNEMRELLQKKRGNLSKLLFVADSGGYPYAFALNYNHLNSAGEPTVYCVWLEEDETDATFTADSFGEFLAGQYFGDAEPIVDLAEAGKYRLVAEGRYEGKHEISGNAVLVSWKICSRMNRILVFSSEDWGWGVTLERSELFKAHLHLAFLPLEKYGVDLDPDFAELIRPAVEPEVLSKYDIPASPDCFQFTFHVQPEWVRKKTSKAFEGKWKNSAGQVWNTSVYSADKAALEKVIEAVAESCNGLRRFFG